MFWLNELKLWEMNGVACPCFSYLSPEGLLVPGAELGDGLRRAHRQHVAVRLPVVPHQERGPLQLLEIPEMNYILLKDLLFLTKIEH